MDPRHGTAGCTRCWLPRSRGDGPQGYHVELVEQKAPPLTRGWTLAVPVQPVQCGGSPAHAGMDPTGRSSARTRNWLPRSRGDGPSLASSGIRPTMAPPLTRGWTRAGVPGKPRNFGSPAHAGMDPPCSARSRLAGRLPRSRGDGPRETGGHCGADLAPPLTRGWTRGLCARRRLGRGSPAHAGMDPPPDRAPGHPRRLPRSRGDGPQWATVNQTGLPAPPLTRGWTRRRPCSLQARSGSPAHAGMDPSQAVQFASSIRLPRSRGDGPAWPPPSRLQPLAPPLTRGWTQMSAGSGRP